MYQEWYKNRFIKTESINTQEEETVKKEEQTRNIFDRTHTHFGQNTKDYLTNQWRSLVNRRRGQGQYGRKR